MEANSLSCHKMSLIKLKRKKDQNQQWYAPTPGHEGHPEQLQEIIVTPYLVICCLKWH